MPDRVTALMTDLAADTDDVRQPSSTEGNASAQQRFEVEYLRAVWTAEWATTMRVPVAVALATSDDQRKL